MSNKAILFVDADFINDIFGRITNSQSAGEAALDQLSETYDIRVTSTVLDEVGPSGPGHYRRAWLESNATQYDTKAFDALGGDRGERSIAAVLDPNYVDPDLGATGLHGLQPAEAAEDTNEDLVMTG